MSACTCASCLLERCHAIQVCKGDGPLWAIIWPDCCEPQWTAAAAHFRPHCGWQSQALHRQDLSPGGSSVSLPLATLPHSLEDILQALPKEILIQPQNLQRSWPVLRRQKQLWSQQPRCVHFVTCCSEICRASHEYLEQGHARGKVVLRVQTPSPSST